MVGVILAMLLVRKLFVRPSDIDIHEHEDTNQTFIATFKVHNPAIFNKSIKEVALLSYPKFVISRLWREGTVSIPTSEKILKENDRLLVITTEKDAPSLTILFGEQENQDWNKEDIDWNAIDSQLISKHIVISRPEINGKKLGSLRLRNSYGTNISRVMRSGVQLLATPGLILPYSSSSWPTRAICSSSNCFCSTVDGAPIIISWAFLFMGKGMISRMEIGRASCRERV